MKLYHYLDFKRMPGISGLFFAAGSFGVIDGNVAYERIEEEGRTTFVYTDKKVRLEAEFTLRENGVILRRDRFFNLTEEEAEIHSLLSRFTLTGNDYEVYTQYNGWQHESRGGWQRLVTQITAASEGIRTCDGATPMMGLCDLYTGRTTVFHLIPNAQWQMTVRKFPRNDHERVVLEMGFHDRALRLRVAAGESIELPTVVFFAAESKVDLDAYKLHEWFLGDYPRRNLPILYNSWLYCFDRVDVDALMLEADCAAGMGFEAFMVDAGWFGAGDSWYSSVGDWEENTLSGPCGRLGELSERVRERGMIFGLWFEPERAAERSRAFAAHPEYYIANGFLDFANPKAVEYIFAVLSGVIDTYRVGWLKFDFNASIPYDPSGNAFYRYMQGQKELIRRLRERYPHIYITNCAGGGFRMELGQGMLFDSFWLSDNQGPYEGIRIVKDTLKRMPSALIERWNVQTYCEDLPVYPGKRMGKMLHCNNAAWDFIIGIKDSFSEEFMYGGPMGFSCDIDAFSAEYKRRWREVIEQYKKERDFYRNATARILVDSEAITAIEYADAVLSRCVIRVFTKTVCTDALLLYPAVDASARYTLGETALDGREIAADGILLEELKDNSCRVLTLIKK